jgi:hypothetical protein
MCANCGFPSAPGHWTEAGAATASDRLRARFRRAQVLQSILRAYGLMVHDDGVTPGLTIATQTGISEMVADLTELWAVAERLHGRPIDPLDPRFVGLADDQHEVVQG